MTPYSVVLQLFFILCVAGGSPSVSLQEPEQTSGKPIRVVVETVAVDAVVTDREGHHIKDLKPEDFEVIHDGKSLTITNLTYIDAEPVSKTDQTPEIEIPVKFLPPEEVRRSIAVVVDDIGMSFENIVIVRKNLQRFINEQIRSTDLVSVRPTGFRVGAVHQFTNDKQQLRAIVERIQWRAPFRVSPLDRGSFDRQFSPIKRSEAAYERSLAYGTLDSIRSLISSMRSLPGRKSMILVSEGFRIWYEELEGVKDSPEVIVAALQRVTEEAHRSGVVIYTIDARGPSSVGLHPSDDLSGIIRLAQSEAAEIEFRGDRRAPLLSQEDVEKLLDPRAYDRIMATRTRQFEQTQQALTALPQGTGGHFLRPTNNINDSFHQILREQQGYYLIGYTPEASTVGTDGTRRFPTISVKVKRPGLKVRFRSTFLGNFENDSEKEEGSGEDRMTEVLNSPFLLQEIGITLTPLYEYRPELGHLISCWLHIDAEDLSFKRTGDGWWISDLEVVAAAFGYQPDQVVENSENFRIRVRGQTYEQLLNNGMTATIQVPIKQSGPYLLRVAVRDQVSRQIGSTGGFIEVPNIESGRLALSGIVLRGSKSTSENGEDSEEGELHDGSMAVRKFQRGTRIDYGLYIYNARRQKDTGQAHLDARVHLFLDGRPIYDGNSVVSAPVSGTSQEPLLATGHLVLGPGIETGEYLLQYSVVDKSANARENAAAQWIRFEVVE